MNELRSYLNKDEKNRVLSDALAQNRINTKKLLRDNYDATVEANKKAADSRRQAESIRNARLMKYLPEYHSAMGLYGNGASESALLEANARHRSMMGAIDASEAQGRADALSAYQTGIASANQSYQNDLLELYRDAKTREEDQLEADEAKKEARASALYSQIASNLQNGVYDSNNLMNYMKTWGDSGMTQEQQNSLNALAGSVIGAEIKERMNTYSGDAVGFQNEFGKYFDGSAAGSIGANYSDLNTIYQNRTNELKMDNQVESKILPMENVKISGVPGEWKKGNNITVRIGDEKYKMELGDVVVDSAFESLSGNAALDGKTEKLLKAAEATVDGGVFLFDDKLYYKMGEQVVLLQKRKNDDAKNNGYYSLMGKIREQQ